MGVDVTAGRTGEVAFYLGASSTRGSLAVRFGMMDAIESVPCSVGIMYEYLFRHDRARITPVAGASFARVFSCASESDGFRPTPAAHSVSEFSGGVRVPIFASQHVVGSAQGTGVRRETTRIGVRFRRHLEGRDRGFRDWPPLERPLTRGADFFFLFLEAPVVVAACRPYASAIQSVSGAST
jgi:hypothetical protein